MSFRSQFPWTAAALFAALAAAGPAAAQTPAPPAPGTTPQGQTPAPSTGPCAAQPDNGTSGKSLSGQLSDCQGVVTPPAGMDPKIQAPAPDPDPGTTPVIKPQNLPDNPTPK